MPLGQTAMTLMFLGKSSPCACRCDSRKPWLQAQRRAGTEGGEDLLVVLGEGGVGDQQQRHVALADHVVHLAQRAVLLGEADGLGLLHRGGAFAQADLDLDAGALERFAQVLRLRRPLRGPADDADLLDAVERLGQQREEVAAAGDDGLFPVGHLDGAGLENLGGESHRSESLILLALHGVGGLYGPRIARCQGKSVCGMMIPRS